MSDCVGCRDESSKHDRKTRERVQRMGTEAVNRVVSLPQADRRSDREARDLGKHCKPCQENTRIAGVSLCGPVDDGRVIWEMLRTRSASCPLGYW